eukprot:403362619
MKAVNLINQKRFFQRNQVFQYFGIQKFSRNFSTSSNQDKDNTASNSNKLQAPQKESNEINFIKNQNVKGARAAHHKRDLDDQYSADNHTLLPYLYLYKVQSKLPSTPTSQQQIGYILMEPRTRHLMAVDLSGDFDANYQIINEIEKQNKSELRYLISTKETKLTEESIESKIKWKEQRPNLQIITSGQQLLNHPKLQTTHTLKDLQTLELGDICICCLETPGHTQDSVSFVVTHVTLDSTKIPFLFSGRSLEIGGCGNILDGNPEQMFYSLQKLINLPNETLLFTACDTAVQNLKFAKYIEPDNPMISHKLNQCQKALDNGDFSVPSKLMEEKLYNPFIRCARDEYFSQITGEQDPIRIFAKIRKLRDTFDK